MLVCLSLLSSKQHGQITWSTGPHYVCQRLLQQWRHQVLDVSLDHVDCHTGDGGHKTVKLRGQANDFNLKKYSLNHKLFKSIYTYINMTNIPKSDILYIWFNVSKVSNIHFNDGSNVHSCHKNIQNDVRHRQLKSQTTNLKVYTIGTFITTCKTA